MTVTFTIDLGFYSVKHFFGSKCILHVWDCKLRMKGFMACVCVCVCVCVCMCVCVSVCVCVFVCVFVRLFIMLILHIPSDKYNGWLAFCIVSCYASRKPFSYVSYTLHAERIFHIVHVFSMIHV